MVEGATFGEFDIPFCPNTNTSIPKDIITYDEAKRIYNKQIKKNKEFHIDVYVCFYCDDYIFDSTTGIWFRYKKALGILKHFKGIITPDFSTYIDFPISLKIFNTYRMRAFGYYVGKQGLEVINNIRGSVLDFDYCFRGIPHNEIVCIGTVGSGLKYLENRDQFNQWILKMVEVLNPHTILIYGSSNYSIFDELSKKGIKIITYASKTARDFKRRSII